MIIFDELELGEADRRGISINDYRRYTNTKNYVKQCAVNKYLKQRSTWWFLETYLSESEFKSCLNNCAHWAYILHDKDVYSNGDIVEPHYHILLHYDNSRTGYAVLKDFVGYQNTFAEKVGKGGPIGCYEYLTHLNDVDKYQYSKSNIIMDNPVYWEHFLPSIRDRTEYDFLEDLLCDDIDLTVMAKRYGRDFIKNYKSYIEFRNEVKPYDKAYRLKYIT